MCRNRTHLYRDAAAHLPTLSARGLQDWANNRKLITSPECDVNWICQKDSGGGRTGVLKELWAGGSLREYFSWELVGWRSFMGSDTSKTLAPLFCPAQQTGGFLTDLQRAVLWDSWTWTTVGCHWRDYSALLSQSHPHPPSISLGLPLLFSWHCLWHQFMKLNHMRPTSVFFLPGPPYPKEIGFR